MKDFNSPRILSHAVEDPDRCVNETPHIRVVSDGSTHPRERFQKVNVIEKSAYEAFRRVRMKCPRPAFDLFKVG
jgi:hypothetical protein